MAGGAASAWLYSRSVHCGCCSRLARRPSKPDDTELDTLLGPDGASGGASGASGGAAGAGVDAHATAVRQLLPAFWRHFWPFLKASWRGRALAGATLLMCLLSAGLSIYISYTARDFNSALTEKDTHGFYAGLLKFVFVILFAIPLDSTFSYVQGHLALCWRVWLTERLLGQYFDYDAFYRLSRPSLQSAGGGGPPSSSSSRLAGSGDPSATAGGTGAGAAAVLDNPDQRICQDVAGFTASSVVLTITLLQKSLNLLGFGGVLWSISPTLTMFLFLYAFGGSFLTVHIFGRPIVTSNAAILRQEADFRYALLRVREHAEAIAFYRAGGTERELVSSRLAALLDSRTVLIWWQRNLEAFQLSYQYATELIPMLTLAPLYFEGTIQFGVISQGSMAFRTILGALSFLVQRFDTLGGLVAETARITALEEQLSREGHAAAAYVRAAAQATTRRSSMIGGGGGDGSSEELLDDGDDVQENGGGGGGFIRRSEVVPTGGGGADGAVPPLELRSLSLWAPGSRPNAASERSAGVGALCHKLSGIVHAGEALLIVGPSGCGKSSILRAIAGLWRLGHGSVRVAPRDACAFLPQQPYLPLGDTLRDQLLFPKSSGGGGGGGEESNSSVLIEALEAVGLRHVLDRVGGLDSSRNWSAELSPGEQQRLAMARLLTGRPSLAFLDEATSALDLKLEAMVYTALRNKASASPGVGNIGGLTDGGRGGAGTTVVSVGHRPSLLQFHTHVLSCENTADSFADGSGGATGGAIMVGRDGGDDGRRRRQEARWVWQTVGEYRARTGL